MWLMKQYLYIDVVNEALFVYRCSCNVHKWLYCQLIFKSLFAAKIQPADRMLLVQWYLQSAWYLAKLVYCYSDADDLHGEISHEYTCFCAFHLPIHLPQILGALVGTVSLDRGFYDPFPMSYTLSIVIIWKTIKQSVNYRGISSSRPP